MLTRICDGHDAYRNGKVLVFPRLPLMRHTPLGCHEGDILPKSLDCGGENVVTTASILP